MFEIDKLTVNYCENPIGISVHSPIFGWRYAFSANVIQRAYRICVAKSVEDMLADNCVWDSGFIVGRKQSGIIYGGAPLEWETEYTVRVQTESEKEETYEKFGVFETGINGEKLRDGFMWTPGFCGSTLLFHEKFSLAETEFEKARLYVCGLGCFDLYINGVRVSDEFMSPAHSQYDKRIYYRTYDAGRFLKHGKNVIGYEVGYGWFGSRILSSCLRVGYCDGSEFESRAGSCNWMVSGSPRISQSVYDGEIYDARQKDKYPEDWCTPDYEPCAENGWMIPVLTAISAENIEPQPCETMRVTEKFPSISSKAIGDGVTVYDAGRNITGVAEIKVRGERGARIVMKFAEGLKEDGTVDKTNLRSAKCEDVYILSGEKAESYCPRFTYHGFRYVQVEIEGKAEVFSVEMCRIRSDLPQTGSFDCSFDKLNKLHDCAVLTEANNQLGTFTDCPQRDERFGWLNDWSARFFQTVYNFSAAQMLEKVAADVRDGQKPCGSIGDTAPFHAGANPADPVSISFLLCGSLSGIYYGNDRILYDNYNSFRDWTEYLLSRSHDGIMEYSYYGDWVVPFDDGGKRTDPIFVSSAFLLWHLRVMSEIAARVGNVSDRDIYKNRADSVSTAIHEKYFNGEDYGSGTQTENALALSLGIAPETLRERIAARLCELTVRLNHHSLCGNQGYRHLFYALADYGYDDEVINVLVNPEYPGWGYMLTNGATTVWERWESEIKSEMNSFNHAMFGSFDAFFYRYLGGIVIPDNADGCDKIEICPHFPKRLDYVDCAFDTVRGRIISAWRREGSKIVCNLEIPSNTVATVRLGTICKTLESGKYKLEI